MLKYRYDFCAGYQDNCCQSGHSCPFCKAAVNGEKAADFTDITTMPVNDRLYRKKRAIAVNQFAIFDLFDNFVAEQVNEFKVTCSETKVFEQVYSCGGFNTPTLLES